MGDEDKKQLEQKLWDIANELRGKMDADEFRDYILGFIFYKYLSEKMASYGNKLLAEDGITYLSLDEDSADGAEYLDAIKDESVEKLGYFLKPSELFGEVAKRGNGDSNNFILEDLTQILNNIERSTMGHESEDDFEGLFDDLDLTSKKLGKTEEAKNTLIAKVLFHLDQINFDLDNIESDVLGDAYEYLIGQFAASAGKKAGEFYTPQQVSKILAKIVTTGKRKLKSVYDPTCGSGSLLLRVAKEVDNVSNFYGQENIHTTYNLARMNMILHNVHYRNFDIKQEDTLEHPQHIDERFEAVVANPPFSAKWSANELHMSDDRFSQYGKLAPKSKADFAFVQHMIHQLDENGTMAVVLPHGVLFRSKAEGHIRKYLIENKNYLDVVIGLPKNMFYNTTIPACIVVFKKCREDSDNILFIDASNEFKKIKAKNYVTDDSVTKIVNTFKSRKTIDKYSYLASLDEVKENDFNLNISRYVNTYEKEKPINLDVATELLTKVNQLSKKYDNKISNYCEELDLPFPNGNNLGLIKQYKKGLMQKIFSQEVRFKADDGSFFPDWKEMELGDVFSGKKGKGLSKDDVVQNGRNKCILYGELYTIYTEVIDKVISRTDSNTGVISQAGDLLIPCSTTTNAIDLADVTVINENNILLGGDISILRFREGGNSTFFAYYLTHFKKFDLARYGQGSTIIHLYYNHFKKIELRFPSSIEEQTKIAELLYFIDKKINQIDSQPVESKHFKTELLQQVFV